MLRNATMAVAGELQTEEAIKLRSILHLTGTQNDKIERDPGHRKVTVSQTPP